MERAPFKVPDFTRTPLGLALAEDRGYRDGVDDVNLAGVRDDSFDRPQVTPDPAPSDDGLFRMAGLGTAIAGIVVVLAWRWLRANIVISRR